MQPDARSASTVRLVLQIRNERSCSSPEMLRGNLLPDGPGRSTSSRMDWREPAINVLAGGLSGMCVDSVLYPLDTIKTRLQARQTAAAGKAVASSAGKQSFRAFYKG